MKNTVNDFWECIEDARDFVKLLANARQNDNRVYRALTYLAKDEAIGFLAYVIWKGRGRWLSSLRSS